MQPHLILLGLLSLQCSRRLTNVRGDPRIRSGHKIIKEIIKLKEGTYYPPLNCSTLLNGSKVDVFWKKDGELVPFGSRDCFPIYYVRCEHNGNYTCFANVSSTVVILKEYVVEVSAENRHEVCGRPAESLWQGSVCFVPTINDYPCCKFTVPPPRILRLSHKISSKFKGKCDLDKMQNPTPWKIDVGWDFKHNATGVWGWQVSLTGLDQHLNVQRCVQINNKHWRNWTFHDLPFGGKYEIKVQSLLSNLKNYVVESIVLPKRIDICKEIGRKCHWERCFPVNDFHQEKASAVLSWNLSKYHEAPTGFEIYYNSSEINCSDIGRRKFKNTTRVVLEVHKCSRYQVKVRPIFSDGEKGTFSKEIVFFRPQNPTANRPTTKSHTEVEVVDVIVAGSVAFVVLIIAIIAAILIKRKRKIQSNQLIAPPLIEQEVISNPSICMSSLNALEKTKVFFVHDNHCRMCNNVTHLLANLLNGTGYVECILDFFRMNEITDKGMVWYEEMIQLCDKVIVVCTKDGKKMYDEKYQTDDSPYVFILRMLLGQMTHHQNRKLQIIPLCFDISSHEDIPLFLSEYTCYSIPSQVQELLSAVFPEDLPRRTGEPSLYDTSDEATMVGITRLKVTIEMVRRDHKGYN